MDNGLFIRDIEQLPEDNNQAARFITVNDAPQFSNSSNVSNARLNKRVVKAIFSLNSSDEMDFYLLGDGR
jgi:hypothetical protein